MSVIAKTGFYVSLVSYGIFWLFDVVRPGFVSRSFSVHLFLLAALIFGIWWGITVKEYMDRPWAQMPIAIVLGFALSVITWGAGEGFGALRLVVVVITFFIPTLFWRLVQK
jgi:hypothetical protein